MYNHEAFQNALNKATDMSRIRQGIGMQSEKTVHLFLKNYLYPDENFHEVKIGRFVADICDQNRITEIQTRSFNAMRKKLEFFLESGYDVTVVYPLAALKNMCWINPETGDISKTRKSPKKMSIHDAFYELYKIKSFLKYDNLHFRFILLELTEYRNLDGWSEDGKKGSTRFDRIPSGIMGDIYVENISDYKKYLPDGLPDEFTSRDYAKCAKVSLKRAQTALNVLKYVDAVEQVGRKGSTLIYNKV